LKNSKPGLRNFTTAKKLAFIQCVGSRDLRFYPFLFRLLLHALHQGSHYRREHEPETTSTIFGMDIRAVGKGFEEYKVRGGNQSNILCSRTRGRNPRAPTTTPF
jgi:heterodisulfide reductase subunit A-like polyferredoxin